MKYLFFVGVDGRDGRLKFLTESSLKDMHYQEILSLAMGTYRYQRSVMIKDSTEKNDKLYYGKPIVLQLERSFEFIELAFPDIRSVVKGMLSSNKRN